jgi:hypothetical protein
MIAIGPPPCNFEFCYYCLNPYGIGVGTCGGACGGEVDEIQEDYEELDA